MQCNDFRIFIDVDGVVANWMGRAIEFFGLDLSSDIVRQLVTDNSRSLQEIINERFMWEQINLIGSVWWEYIPLFPWSKYLYEEMKKLAHVCFLTKPSRHGSAAAGKSNWIQKHFVTRDFLIGAPKHFCASRYSILIDDNPNNVEKFIKSGGNAIEFTNAFKLLETENPDFAGKKEVDSISAKIKHIIELTQKQDALFKNCREKSIFELYWPSP